MKSTITVLYVESRGKSTITVLYVESRGKSTITVLYFAISVLMFVL